MTRQVLAVSLQKRGGIWCVIVEEIPTDVKMRPGKKERDALWTVIVRKFGVRCLVTAQCSQVRRTVCSFVGGERDRRVSSGLESDLMVAKRPNSWTASHCRKTAVAAC